LIAAARASDGVEALLNLIDDPAAAGHHRLLMNS
jgi:hypothetical protein